MEEGKYVYVVETWSNEFVAKLPDGSKNRDVFFCCVWDNIDEAKSWCRDNDDLLEDEDRHWVITRHLLNDFDLDNQIFNHYNKDMIPCDTNGVELDTEVEDEVKLSEKQIKEIYQSLGDLDSRLDVIEDMLKKLVDSRYSRRDC